jgi:hypothetical protein
MFSDSAKTDTRIVYFNFRYYNQHDPFNIGKKVNDLLSDIDDQIKKLDEDVAKEKTAIMTSLVNFDYTISNVYRMLFAHMQTFVTEFYNMLHEAYLQGNARGLNALDEKIEDTDLPGN